MEKHSKKIVTPTMKTEIFQFVWSKVLGFDIDFNIDPKGLTYNDCKDLEKELRYWLRRMLHEDERVKKDFLVVIDANWDDVNAQYSHTKKKTVNVQIFVHSSKGMRTWKEASELGKRLLLDIEATILQVVLNRGIIIQEQLKLCS